MLGRQLRLGLATAIALAVAAPAAHGSAQHGDLVFPENENAQAASWDYWWGAGRLVTESGNRYVVGLAFTSIEGDMSAGYQLFPLQGPYKHQSIMTMEGPPEWGHPEQPAGRFVNKMTVNAPGTEASCGISTAKWVSTDW